jgi:hypothetical protein
VKLDLVVIRVNKQGIFRNSRPCVNCLAHLTRLRKYNLRYIFYTTDEGTLTRVKFARLLADTSGGHTSKRFSR